MISGESQVPYRNTYGMCTHTCSVWFFSFHFPQINSSGAQDSEAQTHPDRDRTGLKFLLKMVVDQQTNINFTYVSLAWTREYLWQHPSSDFFMDAVSRFMKLSHLQGAHIKSLYIATLKPQNPKFIHFSGRSWILESPSNLLSDASWNLVLEWLGRSKLWNFAPSTHRQGPQRRRGAEIITTDLKVFRAGMIE